MRSVLLMRTSVTQARKGYYTALPASPRNPVTLAPRSRLRRPPALSGRFALSLLLLFLLLNKPL